MQIETCYRGFCEKRSLNSKNIMINDKCVNGVWVEGVYFQHIKRNPCPIDDCLKDEDVEHLIIFNSFSDWNLPSEICQEEVIGATVCKQIKSIVINGKYLYEKDIISFNFTKNSVIYNGIGYVMYDHDDNVVVITKDPCNKRIVFDYGSISNVKIVGNYFENPELVEGMQTTSNGVNGKIINCYWDNSNGLTFYIVVADDSHRTWKFGGIDLNNKFAARWVAYMMDMFGTKNISNSSLNGLPVFLAIENEKPVAISYKGNNGLKIIDLRNFFDED